MAGSFSQSLCFALLFHRFKVAQLPNVRNGSRDVAAGWGGKWTLGRIRLPADETHLDTLASGPIYDAASLLVGYVGCIWVLLAEGE